MGEAWVVNSEPPGDATVHTFASPLLHARRNFADRTALVCGEKRFTYAETVDRCSRLAGALYAMGLQPGDRVAVLSANSHQNVEAWAGLPAAGLVVVPLNTRHAEPELLYALEDSGAKVLLTDRDPGALAGGNAFTSHFILHRHTCLQSGRYNLFTFILELAAPPSSRAIMGLWNRGSAWWIPPRP